MYSLNVIMMLMLHHTHCCCHCLQACSSIRFLSHLNLVHCSPVFLPKQCWLVWSSFDPNENKSDLRFLRWTCDNSNVNLRVAAAMRSYIKYWCHLGLISPACTLLPCVSLLVFSLELDRIFQQYVLEKELIVELRRFASYKSVMKRHPEWTYSYKMQYLTDGSHSLSWEKSSALIYNRSNEP